MRDRPEDFPIPDHFVLPESEREHELKLRELAVGYDPLHGYILPQPDAPTIDPTEWRPE